MRTHPPRAFPWEIEPPVGNHHVKAKPRPKARERRPRARPCLNKRCGRKYQPRRWNQRYCQDPECLREVRSWLAARRQAEHRRETDAKAEHAQAERESAASEPSPRLRSLRAQNLRRRMVTQQKFFSPSRMRSARLLRTVRDLDPQPVALLLRHLPASGSQCPGP
jgi:hypothetical protein